MRPNRHEAGTVEGKKGESIASEGGTSFSRQGKLFM